MSPCMLSLHLFLGRPRLLLPETSSLSDFAQMWLGSRLKQWPNHFSLLFSRKVSTGFTWASFLMSSFLMWSNLVFPLAHLNILISAEFSLLSSFFFTAQHSEPYVIAGLIIVLKTLSFNSTGIFLSHITPDTSFHFIHPILILLLTSACEPPSLVNSEPRYLKDVTVGSSASTSFTVVSVSFVGLGKYSVFVLLIFSPCLSNTTLHVSRSSSTSSRVIAHSTRSSANIIAQGGSFSMFSVRTSIIIMNKRGLRADPWCNPTSIGKYSVSPFCVTTCVLHDLYMSCTIWTYSSGTPFFLKHHQIRSLGILSNAFSRSTKTMCKSLFFSLHFSCSRYQQSKN